MILFPKGLIAIIGQSPKKYEEGLSSSAQVMAFLRDPSLIKIKAKAGNSLKPQPRYLVRTAARHLPNFVVVHGVLCENRMVF
jgi:hypothetical protein